MRFLCLICVFLVVEVLSDENYRLKTNVQPISYFLTITPNFIASEFNGDVTINVKTNETGVKQIILHSEDLNFTSVKVCEAVNNVEIALNSSNPYYFNVNYTFVYINLKRPMTLNCQYKVVIKYKGIIRDRSLAFYKSSYVDEHGVKKWLGATQMASTHARKVFPCFDEPSFKAVFNLAIDRPSGFSTSFANAKLLFSRRLSNGQFRDVFHSTPKMSTYLIAFLISDFKTTSKSHCGEGLGVVARPNAIDQATHAQDFERRALAVMSEYFGVEYYSMDSNLKLDLVAVPDSSAIAMENWGLIMFEESRLLYVSEESTPAQKVDIYTTIAHETSHAWIGNLVTMHWWSDLWLNEGFGNYFQNYMPALVEPDLGTGDMLVTDTIFTGYAADETSSASAMSGTDINSPDEVDSQFSLISYHKAGSVIRMMHHLIGDEAFRYGIHAYLENHKFSTVYPEDLYSALQQGVSETGSFDAYPNASVASIMSSWVTQAGHPLLQVDVNYDTNTVILTQKRFYINASESSDEIYKIPITYATSIDPNFEETKPSLIMEGNSYVLNTTVNDNYWILFNVKETGFYRVNYDARTWRRIGHVLSGNQRTVIHKLNRAKIVNDLFALYNADVTEFKTLLEVLKFLTQERDYSVWFAALTGFKALRKKFFATKAALSCIDSYTIRLLENVADSLGYTVNHNDEFSVLKNRAQILEYACNLGHQGCVDNSLKLFSKLRTSGIQVSPSLRPVVYCNGLRYGNGDDFDFLWQKMLRTNYATEITNIQMALGCTRVTSRLKKYLNVIKEADSPIRRHALAVPLTSVLANHSTADLAVEFLQQDFDQLNKIYEQGFANIDIIVNLIGTLHTKEQFDQFESWLKNCTYCSEDVKVVAQSSIDDGRATLSWVTSHLPGLISDLKNASAC